MRRSYWRPTATARTVAHVTGVDGVTGWTNASQVAGGYRNSHAIGPTDDTTWFGYTLPAAKRQPFTPYLVSFSALVTGAAGTFASAENYGRIYSSSDWQQVSYVLRWPLPDSIVATQFRVVLSLSQIYKPTSIKVDNLHVQMLDRDQYAQWADGAVTRLGGGVTPFTDPHRLDNMPLTRSILRDGGVLTILLFGDSISNSTSHSAYPERIGRAFPNVRVDAVNVAIGGSHTDTWTSPDGQATMRNWITLIRPKVIGWGCISDPFTTESEFVALFEQMKALRDELVPGADVFACSRMFSGPTDTDVFVKPIADAQGIGFVGMDGKFREWFGGSVSEGDGSHTFPLPDGTHPDDDGCELLGEIMFEHFNLRS